MADEETAPGGGEAGQAQEELEAARADVARLEAEAANSVSEAESLRKALADANGRIESAAREAVDLRAQVEAATQRERDAAVRYREVVLRAEPALPSEMIAGDSIDAIDASLATAREVVTRVRSHLESQSEAARVPAGAPARGAPDISAMTPQQKIRYGLEQRAQG